MKVEVDGHTFLVSFRHKQFAPPIARRTRRRGWTECRIVLLEMVAVDGGRPLATTRRGWLGRSECSRKDPFSKATGRRLSLVRALGAMIPIVNTKFAATEIAAACIEWLREESK